MTFGDPLNDNADCKHIRLCESKLACDLQFVVYQPPFRHDTFNALQSFAELRHLFIPGSWHFVLTKSNFSYLLSAEQIERNYLTAASKCVTVPALEGATRMIEHDQPGWSRRPNFAKCREPYKTQLDTVAYQWVTGVLTNEEVAFEAVQLLAEIEWVQQPDSQSRVLPLDDVAADVKLLTEAMLAAVSHPDQTEELRQQALNAARAAAIKRSDPAR